MSHGRWYDRIMKPDKNFKGSLLGLLGAALRHDIEDVKDCAAFVAKRLEGYGEKDCADQFREILGTGDFIDGAWTPRYTGDEFRYREEGAPLFRAFESERPAKFRENQDPPSILTPEQRVTIQELLEVARVRLQKLEPLPTCMLVYGTAIQEPLDLVRYIARQLRLWWFAVEPINVVESRTGRWSGQLHKLCEVAAHGACVAAVLKLDKICAPAFIQDSWRVEELKCIRDRFLKNLTTLGTPTVVVACTNMEMELDAADWDRFSFRMELNAAEPDPWLTAARGLALDGFDGFEKAVSSLPAEVLARPFDSRTSRDRS